MTFELLWLNFTATFLLIYPGMKHPCVKLEFARLRGDIFVSQLKCKSFCRDRRGLNPNADCRSLNELISLSDKDLLDKFDAERKKWADSVIFVRIQMVALKMRFPYLEEQSCSKAAPLRTPRVRRPSLCFPHLSPWERSGEERPG